LDSVLGQGDTLLDAAIQALQKLIQ
jgi:hypothetical protein